MPAAKKKPAASKPKAVKPAATKASALPDVHAAYDHIADSVILFPNADDLAGYIAASESQGQPVTTQITDLRAARTTP